MGIRFRQAVQAASVAVLLLVFLFALPLVGEWYAETFERDWPLLADVGEAHGFTAALISGLALAAVAWSVRAQARESKARRLQDLRDVHMELTALALQDPELLDCVPSPYADRAAKKRHYYRNLWFWWWHHLYREGLLSREEVRRSLASYSSDPEGRAFLEVVLSHVPDNEGRAGREFFRMARDGVDGSDDVGAPAGGGPVVRAGRPRVREPRLGAAVAVTAGAAAGFLAGRWRRARS